MSYRDCIVFGAKKYIGAISDIGGPPNPDGPGTLRKGWPLLKEILEYGLRRPGFCKVYPHNKRVKTPGLWIQANGQEWTSDVNKAHISWCGLFAAYVLKEEGGLADVKWMGNPRGIVGQKIQVVKGSDGIRPGDVGVIAENTHHFIVEEVQGGWVTSIDGNVEKQSIARKRRPISQIVSYYQILGE